MSENQTVKKSCKLIEIEFKLFDAFGKMEFLGFEFFWNGKRIIFWDV
jgi:hypothetical protein